ncbi:hypothetical protein N7448_011016 [Penicillium atrosanguineum]|nr:hypothetical protein N7448_011016 [Penicillium atrosanguineum]
MREFILDGPSPPLETGDLAYRGTFSLQELTALNNPEVEKLIAASDVQVWMGPEKHVVFYPVRNRSEFNLVLLCPDDLPKGSRTSEGDLKEMRSNFEGWDPALQTMISCLHRALKWKLCHHEELQRWTKVSYLIKYYAGTIALLGDACHPTLPYQAQGAAMAVEDGAVLGQLLTTAQSRRTLLNSATELRAMITDILSLYETLRKERTETNVLGAIQSRDFYHLCDGSKQMERDQILSKLPESQWMGYCKWNWGDATYQQRILGFDVLSDVSNEFSSSFGLGGIRH